MNHRAPEHLRQEPGIAHVAQILELDGRRPAALAFSRRIPAGGAHQRRYLILLQGRYAPVPVGGAHGRQDLILPEAFGPHRGCQLEEGGIARSRRNLFRGPAALPAARWGFRRCQRAQPQRRQLGQADLAGPGGQLPFIPPPRGMHRRRGDHISALAPHVHPLHPVGPVPDPHARRAAQVQVPPPAAGLHLPGLRQRPKLRRQLGEVLVALVPRVDIDHHQARGPAGRDADVGIGPLPPPGHDLLRVLGCLPAPQPVPGMLAAAAAVGLTAAAAAVPLRCV